jgi:hypothetical protein
MGGMKRVLSISLGSSKRDHTTQAEFLGVPFELSRQGTDGDFKRAVRMFSELDGKVDAFGIGGTLLFVEVANRRYYFRSCKAIRRAVKHSKLADGNGVKHLLEARAVKMLEERLGSLRGKKAFAISAGDRYGQFEALVGAGCDCIAGDLIFTMGLNLPIRTLAGVRRGAALLFPWTFQLPYMWFYPVGEEQERPPVHHPRFTRYYEEAEIIAGDYLWLRKYMPEDMSGKIVLTNTTTARDVEEFQKRGVKLLVSSTPRFEGRSFGTNVMEAMLLCLMDKPQADATPQDFEALIERSGVSPVIEALN